MAANRVLVKNNTGNDLIDQKAKKELLHKPVSSGPWGGDGGVSWDDGVYSGIRQIVLRCGNAVDSIIIEYLDENGASSWSHRHGGSGGRHTHRIVFDHPRETLIGVSGHYGPFYFRGPPAIRALTFHTNVKQHGPFGVAQGTHFETSTVGSRVVGFHGRSGNVLDAIGVYTQLHVKCCDNQSGCDASVMLSTVISSVKDIVDALKVPPASNSALSKEITNGRDWKPLPSLIWGGQGGNPWDDGIYTGICQIVIKHGDLVDSITVKYAKNGDFVWGIKHGGLGKNQVHTICFDYPEEYLMSISGYYGPLAPGKPVVIKSLTFRTNKGTYGPYGPEKGTYFSSPETGRKILGFCGRSGWYLDAIGVHLVAEEHVNGNLNKEEVQAAWKEFVSRILHQKVLVETKSGT